MLSLILINKLYILYIYITSFSPLLSYSIIIVLKFKECATAIYLAFEILLLIKVYVLISRLSK